MRLADRVVAFRRPSRASSSRWVTAVQSVARRLGLDRAGFHVEAYATDPEVTPHVHWHVFRPGREAPRGEDARSKL